MIAAFLSSVATVIRLARADTTAQTIPFSQNWTNTGLITTNDNWSGVPGIEGYLGQDITTSTGTDPQTLLGTSSVANDLTVLANQTVTTITNGDVGEFHTTSQAGAPGADSTIALQGSGTADAPYILLYLNTTGQNGINISYNLRDIDCTTDNASSPVALQYRIGSSGNFTNVPAGFVADATTGPSLCTLVTPVSATLPAAVDNQPLVQVRIMTTNSVGNDEWVGVDDIVVSTGVGGPTFLSINDVSQAETDSGTTTFKFTVSLSAPAGPAGVTFDIATQDGTATVADNDYIGQSLTNQTITQGNTTYTFNVTVNGDTTVEPNQTFFVNVSNVSGATVNDGQGLGTIVNDDVTLTAIHDIQGPGSTSPLAGSSVSTRGIVTALKSGSSGGFFIQELDGSVDADPNTSEGIFVFTGASLPPGAVIGNLVQVTGNVQEFIPAADPNQNPLTELSSPSVVVISTGNPLPSVVTLTAANTTAPSHTAEPLDTLEEFEGMRVTVPTMVVCAPTQGTITESSATVASTGVFYGVVSGVARPFREPGINISDPIPTPTPNPNNIPRFDENPERLRVDSDAQPGTAIIDVPAGTILTDVTGPLDYAFRSYTILPDAATPPGIGPLPTASPVPTPNADELTVASFNMERFFDTVNDPNTSDAVLQTPAFNNRLNKASLIIRNIMLTPDVIGVVEMENLTTLQAVADKVNNDAVGAGQPNPNYLAFLSEGNDVGGIDVGFLVKSSRITVNSVTQLELAGCDHTTATTCYNYTNPNDGQPDILNDRPPLVLEASIVQPDLSVLPFTVIVNHLRSLSGVDDPVDGNRIRTKRRAQAEFLANYIQNRQTTEPQFKLVSVGDYNGFDVNDGFVDVMGTIRGNPAPADQVLLASSDLVDPDLFALSQTVPANQRYSFTFDGNAQELDHILVNNLMRFRLTRLAFARTDSDFPQKYYEDPNRPERLSDHDPAVAYFTLNVAPTAANGIIAGRVTNEAGAPVAGAVINLTGTQTRKTITDADGNYRFEGVETNGFYQVTPSRANYTFNPGMRVFSQLVARTEAPFAATSQTETANPLDTPEYFVRQQYLDVLGREPDEGGFNYWSNQILGCAGDATCLNARRREVAAAFFIEAEFQRTGSYLYGLYQGALGRQPLYQEFSNDRLQVIDGPSLEQMKQAFAESFVTRAEFVSKYQAHVAAGTFVDALLANVSEASGIDLRSQRAAFIDRYNSGASLVESRSLALRAITESDAFKRAEYNRAFVLTEYFGYLKRDADSGGYAFWLDVLNNRDPGNYRGMVCSFITSAEYQQRFSSIVSHSNSDCAP